MSQGPPVPVADLIEMTLALHVRLDEIGRASPRSPEESRAKAILLLRTLAEFLSTQRHADYANSTLLTIAQGLSDLDSGIVSDLLKPKKRRGGQPPSSTVTWRDRCAVAIAFNSMTRAGMSQENAAQHIVRKHKWVRELVGKRARGEPTRAIVDWALSLAKKTTPYDTVNESFAEGVRQIAQLVSEGKLPPDRLIEGADRYLSLRGKARLPNFHT
jgi:hypothetical protein